MLRSFIFVLTLLAFAPIVTRLNTEIVRIVNTDDVRAALLAQGARSNFIRRRHDKV